MVVTLEPCDMCKAVLKEARLKKIFYIIPRYKFKKQYKCTTFEQFELRDERVDKYRSDITHFFDNKR